MPIDYWPEFRKEVSSKGVPADELLGYLQRLSRTGCVHILPDARPDASQRAAYTTPIFQRLVNLVEDEAKQ